MSSSLATKRTVAEIQNALARRVFDTRNDIMIPNLSWGLLNHEADFVVINKSHYLTEVEIKRSLSDLKADFKKDNFHRDELVSRFFYCLPLSIREKALEVFKEHVEEIRKLYGSRYMDLPAIIWYDEELHFTREQGSNSVAAGRKLFIEEINTVTRLISIRYWSLLNDYLEGGKQ